MNPKNPTDWSTDIVCAWANELKYSTDTISSFSANLVDGAILLSLNASDIRDELKISSITERRRLLADVTALKAMACLEREKTSGAYQNLETAIQNREMYLFNQEDDYPLQIQEKELVEYRKTQDNFAVAVETQLEYNKLQFLDEIDAQLAARIGDRKSNREAEASIKMFHDSVNADEARRRRQNEFIINESAIRQESMDLQSTEPVQGIVGGNASSALSKQFNVALIVGASESKEESDEVSQVTSTTVRCLRRC